jgi:hypothetical protein
MTDSKKKTSEDLMASLLAELKLTDGEGNPSDSHHEENGDVFELAEGSSPSISMKEVEEKSEFGLLDLNFGNSAPSAEANVSSGFDGLNLVDTPDAPNSSDELVLGDSEGSALNLNITDEVNEQFKAIQDAASSSSSDGFEGLSIDSLPVDSSPGESIDPHLSLVDSSSSDASDNSEKTVAISRTQLTTANEYGTGERTVAVAGYSNRSSQGDDGNVKISVGQSGGGSSGYGGWGSTDSNLAQAENLKMAQSKILTLEKENEKLRHQNEELVSASEIIKERSDLLTAQVYEYKNDREDLESSFKNEMALIKSQLNRKDAELQKAQMKIEELDSRLKFDMKKIRIRERELENRLELIRAEKNALVRSKDEQILESRRKLDQLQLEVDSFRQKCVELNRVIETNQDSFKRTTRALRLAMANLELQEENKMPLKKVD